MKSSLKIFFTDFWNGFDMNQNLIIELLRNNFDVQIDGSNPDLIFYSCYGFKFLDFNCHRIFYTAENVRPDHNECDFSLTFDYNDYGGKNLRLPLYLFSYLKHLESGHELEIYKYPKTKFCNMVVSNPNCKTRNHFFKILTKLKRVDSGGRFMNNMGGPINDKLKFIAEYRFTIAFENESYPGYTTEKLVEPMLAGSIPIYWGNPKINTEFNSESFINVHEYSSLREVADHILEIEENNKLYNEIKLKPWLINDRPTANQDYNLISNRLRIVINDLMNQHPIGEKTRRYSRRKKSLKQLINKITKKPIWQI